MSALPMNAIYEGYLRAGFALTPIHIGTKSPIGNAWNRRENMIKDVSLIPEGAGVGLCHAFSSPTTCALDIDNWTNAAPLLLEQGIDIEAMLTLPDSVMIDSGNPGHAKFIFKLPFGLILPSKTVTSKDNGTVYELRCGTANSLTTQDVLPSAACHPKTLIPYQWSGKGHWSALPIIPMEILTFWQSLFEKELPASKLEKLTDFDAIKAALECIPADCSHDQWFRVLMALHHAGTVSNQLDAAFTLADEWSAKGTKYKHGEPFTRWRSFKAGNGITAGTLFSIATEYGYTRPVPDVTGLFSAITPSSPTLVNAYLHPSAPAPNLDHWPDALASVARQTGISVGCDPTVPLLASLGAVCGALDSRIRLEIIHGWQVPPVLWLMTIGAPADKKTPGSTPFFKVLEEIENADRDRYNTELQFWQAQEASYALSVKARNADTEFKLKIEAGTLEHIAVLPPQPTPLRIIVSDITSQRIVYHAQGNPRGMLCYLDEMAGWCAKLTNARSTDDRSTWTSGYDCKQYKMDRVGAPDIRAEHYALSIYGNIQPQVLKKYITELSTDGLLQRFLPCILQSDLTTPGDAVIPCLSELPAFNDLIRKLFTLPIQTYTLSSEAYKIFRDFQYYYNDLKNAEILCESNAVYMKSLGKIEGTLGRIALIFHLVNDPYNLVIPLQTMIDAVNVVKMFLIPSLRYTYQVIVGLNSFTLDQWIIDHIIMLSGETETVTLSELTRSARRKLENLPAHTHEGLVTSIMSWLATQNWVQVIKEDRRTTVWAINKQLSVDYAERKKAIATARAKLMEPIIEVRRVYQAARDALDAPDSAR